ncbi:MULTISPECIES: magnesium/cobalt transporter CorA [Paenibacillus]|uniref:Magnesium transport protein CorA n=1 Tax=Paenibacillus vini TaxID=1476024 RepID=A0ABQ4MA75_9BACL|nr:magnesium/cobalt transporter CorA [Paenibacillus vini]MDN4066719.1 magnesium/cobalt transporter CorA [Paenibacillus vini]GIP52904.1 putative metal ion transporter YfjQ [Paenibacillus vini]
MIRAMGITHDHKVETGIPLESIGDSKYGWSWVDFNEASAEEAEQLDHFFHFHPLAIEDCLHVLQRPKVDYYEGYEFLVLHALDPETLNTEEVNLFIGDKVLVSFHHRRLKEIDDVWNSLAGRAQNRKAWARGPFVAAYMVIDALVDQYFPCVYAVEDELDELEKQGSRESVEVLMNQVFDLRSRLLKLRRTIVPMRDLMYRILNSQHIQGEKEPRAYFADIHDHLLKLAEMIETDREMTADLRDSYISLNSNRMNGIMKTLTVITTVFMPLTLIAGIYGMNFAYMPELEWRYGYFAVLGLMGLLSIWMIFAFLKRGWFK